MSGTLEEDDLYANTYGSGVGAGSGLPDENEVAQAPSGYGGGYAPLPSGTGAGQGPVFPHTPGSRAVTERITGLRTQIQQARQAPQGTPGEIYTPTAPYPAAEVQPGFWEDAGKKIWASTKAMGEGVLGATAQVQEAIGSSPEAKAWVQDRRKELQASVEHTLSTMAPERQKAAMASLFGGVDPITGAPLPTPGEVGWGNYFADRLFGFVPQAVLLALPGGAVSRIAQGLVFGTLGSGDAFNRIADQIGQMTADQLRENPLSREVLNSGGSLDDAKHALLRTQATGLQALGHAVTGAVMGAGLGGIVGRGGGALGAAGRGRLGHAALGGAEAGGVLGGAAGATEALGQSQQIDIGAREKMDPSNIARFAAGGFVGGAVLGGSMGALRGPRRSPEPGKTEQPETRAPEGVPPDVHAVLQGELDLTQPATGATAKTVQSEPPPPGGAPPPPGPPGPPASAVPGGGVAPEGGVPIPPQGVRAPPPPEAAVTQPFPAAPPVPAAPEVVGTSPVNAANVTQPAPPGTVPEISNAANVAQPFPASPSVRQPGVDVTQPTPITGKLPGEPTVAPTIGPTSGPEVAPPAQAVQPRPSAGMKLRELRDALRTMPGQDPRKINVMKFADAAKRYDEAMAGSDTISPTVTQATPPLTTVGKTEPAKMPRQVAAGAELPREIPQKTAPALEPAPVIPRKAADEARESTAEKAPPTATTVKEPIPEKPPTPTPEAAKPEISTRLGEIIPPQVPVEPAAAPKLTKAQQLIADAKAKRAAQRARVTGAPIEREGQPKAHVEPETTPAGEIPVVAPKAPAEAPAERLGQRNFREEVVTAVRSSAIAREIVPLKTGEVSRVVDRVLRELEARLEDVTTAAGRDAEIVKWAASPDPIPGTKTRREAIANPLLRMLTGKSLDELSGRATRPTRMGREAGEEARTQTQKFEVEREGAGEGTTTVHEAAPGSEGVDRPRAPTTDREKRAYELLDEVRQGTKTAAEAHAAYGQPFKGPGRPRREELATFPEFLEREIRRAEDPKLREAIIAALTKTQTDTGERGATKGNTSKAEAKLLERTSPEYLAELRELHREITDPVGLAADREAARRERISPSRDQISKSDEIVRNEREFPRTSEKLITDPLGQPVRGSAKLGKPVTRARARPAGLRDAMSSRYVRVREDPRLNDHIHNQIFEGNATLHGLLRSVLNHAATKDELRPLWELARAFVEKAPDLPVVTATLSRDRGWMGAKEHELYGGQGTAGYFWPKGAGVMEAPEHIAINPGAPSAVETLLHETSHAITTPYLHALEMAARNHGRIDPDYAAMSAIKDEFYSAVNDRIREGYFGTNPEDRATVHRVKYMLSNVHELHTILYTDPRMQALAAEIPASAEFRSTMRELGFPARPAGTSLWRYFTDWIYRALGIRRPASESEFTMLDTILRPLQDVTDRAIAFNRRTGRMPEGGEAAAPLRDAVERAFSAGREEAADRLSRAGHWSRRFFLPAMGVDRIYDRYGHLFETAEGNSFADHRAAVERIAASGKKFFDTFQDKATGLSKRLKNRDELAALMNDTTLAKVHLDNPDPTANDHLTTPAQRATQGELERRFTALTNADKQLYRETREFYRETHAAERTAEQNGIINEFLGDLTPAQQETVRTMMRSKRALDAFIKEPENSPIADAFKGNPESWANYRGVIKGMAQFNRQGFVQGDYFPLRRNGDYVVVYGEKGTENYGVEMFESPHAAEARRQELIQQGVKDVFDTQIRDTNTHIRMPASSVTDELVAAAKNIPGLKDNIAQLQSTLDSIRLRHMTYAEASRVRARRRGIAGASKEASRVLAGEAQALGLRIGYLEHGGAPERALNAMRIQRNLLSRTDADASGTGRSMEAGDVINELAQRDRIGESAQRGVAALARKATSFGYVQSLLSFSRIATESVEHTLMAGAWLGGKHGYGKAGLAIARAQLDLAPKLLAKGAMNTLSSVRGEMRQADWNLGVVMRDRLIKSGANRQEMEALFGQAIDAGLLDMTFSRSLQQMAQPGGGRFVEPWQRFLDMAGAMQHATEATSRGVTLLAGYRLERANGATAGAARAYAVDMLRKLPNWNPGARPRISSDKGIFGKFSAPIMQFKNYGLNAYALLANLSSEAMRGATPQARSEARWVLAGTIASHTMTAGVLTWLADPLRYIGGAYDLLSGDAPHDYQADVRNFMSDVLGPEIGEVASRGLPHMMGIDVHNRLGMQNVLNIPALNGFTKKDWIEWLGTGVAGAAGEDAASMGGGFYKILTGDFMGGLTDALPRIVRDPLKAARLATKGVTDPTGHIIVPPEKITPYDVGVQALGFQPSRVSEAREGRNAILQVKTEWERDRNALINKWLEAAPADRANVMSKIREYNSGHHGMQITMSQLLQNQAARRKQAKAPGGLRLTPKTTRELGSYGRFAPA